MGVSMGNSVYPDLGKLVRAMTEKPVFDIPIGGSRSTTAEGRLLF